MDALADYNRDIWSAVRIVSGRASLDVLALPADKASERLRRLVEALRFSRWFVPTYNLVLASVLVLVSLYNFYGLWRHRRLVRAREMKGADADWTSESSTLAGSSTPSSISSGERKPLLGGRDTFRQSGLTRISHRVQGWLMYQPANIPVVDKVLPSNLTSVGILLFIALNGFFLLYRIWESPLILFMLGSRAGLLFVVNLPLLYLLAAKNAPVKRLTGYSYETLNIFHRRLGELMAFLAALHAFVLVVVYFPALIEDPWAFFTAHIIWTGIAAFLAYEVLYLTSLSSIRQRAYELFLASHIVLQASALGFLYFHYHITKPYILASAAIFIVDRGLYRLFLARTTIEADVSILPDGETLLMSASYPLPVSRSSRPSSIADGWLPTDHIFITFPSLSNWQAHPFTIASAAPLPGAKHAWLDLLIRARAGFTASLLAAAPTRVPVVVDGPYGNPHARHLLESSKTAVLVAGGSGVAVTFPLAWHLAHLTYGPKVVFVWVVRERAHLQWLGEDRIADLRERGVRIIVPQPTREGGRPDVDTLMDEAVGHGKDVGVVVSGPDELNRSVRNWCANEVGKGRAVRVGVEKFGW